MDRVPEDETLKATLENGLRAVIVRNNLAPVVTTAVNYLVGSNEAPEGFPGMAHAQEHMMFRGSPGLTATQLTDVIAAMGGTFDANTQQTVTQYFLTLPTQDLEVALQIEAIRMRGVLDTGRLWSLERGAIEQEIADDLSSPDYISYTRALAGLFKGTPYAHTPLGSIASFDRTTGTMLRKFYDAWYAPNNAILVIVGNVEPKKALAGVKKFFGPIPAKKIPDRPEIRFQPVRPETLRLKTDQAYGLIMISFRMPGYRSPDYPVSQVLADVLNNQRGSLFTLVPEGNALFTGFRLNTLPDAGLGYAIAAFPKGADSSILVDRVRRILARDGEKGFPADLVEAAKRARLMNGELQKNSVSGLAAAWSKALAVEGRQSPEDGLVAVRKVSVADVDRVAARHLKMNEAITTILTPEGSRKAVTSASSGNVKPFPSPRVKPVKLPHWAEKTLKRVPRPPSRVNPFVTVLANGITLIVEPESVSDTVSVYGHIRNKPDLQAPEGKDGVDQVLSRLLSYGTTTLDRLAFQKALDEIGANESAGTDFSLQVLSQYFERGVELLADNELNPALPEDAFTVTRQQVASTIAGRLRSPDYLAERALKAALFPENDPTLRQATPASVSSLTLKDVKDYYRKVFRPDLTTIVAVGRVTPERALSVIEERFGPWQATGPRPDTLLAPVPANKPSTTAVRNRNRVQTRVTLVQTLGLFRSDPDYYALDLGNHILGGSFFASRLYRDLREETGLVYYVTSSFEVGLTRSLYVVNFGCDPQNVPRARAIVERNLKEMQTAPVPADRLQQAKALLLREILLAESNVDLIADGLLYRSIHNLPLDEPIQAARRYLKLTPEDVKAAFAKWLRPGDLVQITEGPTER